MRNFLLLLKCDLRKLFAGKNGKRAQGSKIAVSIIVGILVGFFILLMSGSYTGIFLTILPKEKEYLSASIILFIFCLIVLFSTIGTSKILFGASDYDFLMSLPIKPQTVILSKLAYLYIISLCASILCLCSSAFVYVIFTQSGAITLLNALLISPFLATVPLLIGLILGTGVNILLAKVKRKNLVSLLFATVFLVLYFVFIFNSSNFEDSQILALLERMQGFLAPFSFVAKGLLGNYLNILIFALIVCACAFLYVYTLGKYYKKVNGLITAKRVGANFKLEKSKSSSLQLTLLKRELKVYFSNSSIILNSLIGPIMCIVLGVVAISKGGINALLAGFSDISNEEMEVVKTVIKSLLPYIPFFFIGLSSYTAYSVSLEGKNLWIIKSMPIKAKNWLNAKVMANLVVTMPAGIISVILFGIALNVVWYDVIIAVVIISIYSVVGALLGLFVNLKFPNFNWSNPAEVVKRGTSATICVFCGMFAFIPVAAIQVVCTFISPYLGFAAVGVALCILVYLFYYLAYTKAEKKLLNF